VFKFLLLKLISGNDKNDSLMLLDGVTNLNSKSNYAPLSHTPVAVASSDNDNYKTTTNRHCHSGLKQIYI
jgi:hypothetical protein